MENYIRKILQGFIRFQYSDSLTKQIHHWLIGKENADLLLHQNPVHILKDEKLEEMKEFKKTFGLFNYPFLFKTCIESSANKKGH